VNGAEALLDEQEPLAQLGIAGGGLTEGEFGGGALEVVAQEGGVGAVAGRVDADADTDGTRGRLRNGLALW
jgi:hypothetical protein